MGKNFPDISNIKKIWGVLVMARFGPGNLIEGAPFSEVIPRARPPGRGEHVRGVSWIAMGRRPRARPWPGDPVGAAFGY